MKCPKCGFTNREGAQYCLNCGKKLSLKCLQCGTILPLKANFCDNCGQNYEELVTIKKDSDTIDTVSPFSRRNNIGLKEAKNHFERSFLEGRLKKFDWNISKTAEDIGIERSNLHKKLKFHNLSPEIMNRDRKG
jgi:DNA-binding NtrC family response regulator